MSRTNIDIDDKSCAEIVRPYRLTTKREAVNLALRPPANRPLSLDEARRLRGSDWAGNLEEMRISRLAGCGFDTSALVELLRDSVSDVCMRVDLALHADIAVCDAVRMALHPCARDEYHLEALRRLLARAVVIPAEPAHYEEAAMLFRRCRNQEGNRS